MIEIKELCAGYYRENILDSVDLTVEDGILTVLLGPNGSGKSTLLKTVAGIITPGSGRIIIDDSEYTDLTPRQLACRVSYMAQTRNTPNIIAGRMVLHGRFPYLSYPRRYSRADTEAAHAAMEAADALDIAHCPMTELSGGQRQKVYLAMTLAQDTKNVLMDEPMSFLDIQHQLGLMETAKGLASSGKAVLMVMHDIRMAMQSADRIVVMASGRVLCRGTPEQVFDLGFIDAAFGVKLRRIETDSGYQYYFA